jgi:replicative DNA helicase
MNLYLSLLKLLLEHPENWEKYSEHIDYDFLKGNYPELYRLFFAAERLVERGEALNATSLELYAEHLFPSKGSSSHNALLGRAAQLSVSAGTIDSIIYGVKVREEAAKVAAAAMLVSDGDGEPSRLDDAIQSYQHIAQALGPTPDNSNASGFVSSDLEKLLHAEITEAGLRWRLPSLNKALGSLRRGDFGFVFARPETGKTTFLASELSYMAEQTTEDHPIIWFNNEERGGKVMLRIYQAVFGITSQELYSNADKYSKLYRERIGNRIRLVDEPTISYKQASSIVARESPRLVVFDQIDKLGGFKADRQDLELASIYRYARELAKSYCPVIGICQAGSSGDGKKWLTMNDVDNSKTGKQAEADWILGIGKTYDMGLEALRYFHLSKNKLLGDSDADPSMRHGKWEVKINVDLARYEDFND